MIELNVENKERASQMIFKNMTNTELSHQLSKLVKTERKITHLILQHINEFESRRIYTQEGYDSMFSYLTSCLGYSESSAYSRLQAARLLRRVPEVAAQIESGSLNLSQLIQVEKCLKAEREKGISRSREETQKVLQTIEQCNSFETKKILSVEFDEPVIQHARIIPQKDESVRLEITLTKEQFEGLKQAQSLLSHVCPSGELSEVIATLAFKFIQSKLGKKSETETDFCSISNKKPATQSFAAMVSKSKRKYISVKLRRTLLNESNHSCEYLSVSGNRCASKFQLQIDHRKPLALGGTNEIKNLRILCRTHNNFEADRMGLPRPAKEVLLFESQS